MTETVQAHCLLLNKSRGDPYIVEVTRDSCCSAFHSSIVKVPSNGQFMRFVTVDVVSHISSGLSIGFSTSFFDFQKLPLQYSLAFYRSLALPTSLEKPIIATLKKAKAIQDFV